MIVTKRICDVCKKLDAVTTFNLKYMHVPDVELDLCWDCLEEYCTKLIKQPEARGPAYQMAVALKNRL